MSAHQEPVAVRVSARQADVDEWALVLTAEGFHPIVIRDGGGHFALCLGADEAEASAHAARLLETYESENAASTRATPAPPALGPPSQAGTAIAMVFTVFFFLTGPRSPSRVWFSKGSADASQILDGEVWRTVTALTLHADLAHVASNAVFGALLFNWVCGALGPGVGLAALVAAGAVGNAMNALAHTTAHDSVGASTAVFAAIGLLCGPAMLRRQERGATLRQVLTPIAAGLGLVAMMGVSGARTDIWAHLFGFAAGTAIGAPLAVAVPRRLGPRAQLLCGIGAALVIVASWRFALLS